MRFSARDIVGLIAVTAFSVFASNEPNLNLHHFKPVSPTGNNLIVLLLTTLHPTLNGHELRAGDEIGAFNGKGLCVGANTWLGDKNNYVTVWGDNLQTPNVEGMKLGETIAFRVWDSAQDREYPARVTFHTSTVIAPSGTAVNPTSAGSYVVDGISIMATLVAPADQEQQPIELLSPADSSIITDQSVEFCWARGDSGTDRYAVTIAADSASHVVLRDTVSDTSAVYRKLKPGSVYWWQVQGLKKSGRPAGSPARTFRVLGSPTKSR